MDKSGLHLRIFRRQVKTDVHHMIAHIRTRGIGYRSMNPLFLDSLHELPQRQRGKVCRRSIRNNAFVHRHITGIIRQELFAVGAFDTIDINGNPLNADLGTAARLTDGQHHIRPMLLNKLLQHIGCSSEFHRQYSFDHRDPFRRCQAVQNLLGRIHR